MRPNPTRLLALLSVVMLASGCATRTETAETEEPKQKVAVEAPLGSRIKKRNEAAPVSGATRQDIENAKVLQGIQQVGAANRAGGG
jgi:hypothetical protein